MPGSVAWIFRWIGAHGPRHGKTLGLALIRRFLASRTVGAPQFIAAALLAVYLAECAWLIHVQTTHGQLPSPDHALRIYEGLEQWKGGPIAGSPAMDRGGPGIAAARREQESAHLRLRDGFNQDRSPLYYLIAAAPALVAPSALSADSTLGQLWYAVPYLFFGVMLGGSLWYVARRLYGNSGGYIALILYCFSPAMIVNTGGAQSQGEMGAAWGAFGAIFTAIAVAHTLYAPREVVLWNWRRILLLGLSLVLIVGNQFSLMIVALAALLLMFWVAPIRKGAVITIWITAAVLALIFLFASYFGAAGVFFQSLRHALWFDFQPAAVIKPIAWSHTFAEVFRGAPPLMLLLPAALLTYACWKRARYFGNTAPLLIALLLLVMAAATPLFPGQGAHLAALSFLFVFVSGVTADLLETKYRMFVMAAISGLLAAAAFWNLVQLVHLA